MNEDTRPLPPGWKAQYSPEHGRWYYVNYQATPVTTQWEHPAGMVKAGYPVANQPTTSASGYVDPSYSGGPSTYAVPGMAAAAPGSYGAHHGSGRKHTTSASGAHPAYPMTAPSAPGYGQPHEVVDHASQWGSSHPGLHNAYGQPTPMHHPTHSGRTSDPSSRHNQNFPYHANDANNMSSNAMGSLTNQEAYYPHNSPPNAVPQLTHVFGQPGYTSPAGSSSNHTHGGAPASFAGQPYQQGYSEVQVDYPQTQSQSGYATVQPQGGYGQAQGGYPTGLAQGYSTNAQPLVNQVAGYGQDYSGSSGGTMTGYQNSYSGSGRSR
ncbi:hypothetical protein BDV98DRAFT_560090 [Pterulicium gracile]|uniref:WW domain-containing protein n=1 Tax=Pterulicium gracile TaxID=1884261 RepID=A0A5C3QU67_9AGAR|nr:hypothetical protein BDV98DRAFT_560090 [Pterula gracilis]